MISSTVFAVEFATQTLPELSMATPEGAAPVLPVVVEVAVPVFDIWKMTPLLLATQILLLPSMANALAPVKPVGVKDFENAPTSVNFDSELPPLPIDHTNPLLSTAAPIPPPVIALLSTVPLL